MDIKKYLQRIDYKGPVLPVKESLFQLQKQHLLSVPFENLDIHCHREIVLDPEVIYEKVVLRKRGGFCYELNGLFYRLLQANGFNCKMISARVHKEKDVYGPDFDHLAILTEVDSQWFLVDVGFGKFSLEPLPLKEMVALKDPHGLFIFDHYDQHYWRVNSVADGKKVSEYIFATTARDFKAFESMCQYHQHNPESHFTSQKVVSLALPDGRITLSERSLKKTGSSKIEEESITPELFETRLAEIFGIRLND